MTSITIFKRRRPLALPLGALACGAMLAVTPVPSMAQDSDAEARLRRAEAEIRALQRAVFPGGDGRFFEPQISAEQGPAPDTRAPAPSTTAVTDILARLDAIELQMQRLTALSEENFNALGMMEERIAALETAQAEAAAAAQADEEARLAEAQEDEQTDQGATDSNLAVMTGGASDGSTAEVEEEAPTGPSPERLAAVQEITKPQTDDPADDEYVYGFRLWNAGFLPEARQQLASYVEQNPDHFRISYGRNLLGRAFLDDGMPEEAARWFLRNYQADRTARRAPDSLLFLAEAMIAMEDNRRACIALVEFGETYPAVATGRLADQYESNRRRVNCQ